MHFSKKINYLFLLLLVLIIISPTVFSFWAKANFHTHTLLSSTNPSGSDGDSSVSSMATKYKSLGYNVLSITEHGKINPLCSSTTDLSLNFLCIPGEEWSGPEWKHILRINVSSVAPFVSQYSLEKMTDACVNTIGENSFSVMAHPNWINTIELPSTTWSDIVNPWSNTELNSCSSNSNVQPIIEICNGKLSDAQGRYAIEQWVYLLKSGKKVFAIGNDDAHKISSEVGNCWNKIYVNTLSTTSVVSAIKDGNYYVSTGPSMDVDPFKIICDGTTINMGETANCYNIKIKGTVSGGSVINQVRLYEGKVNSNETVTNLTCNPTNSNSCSFILTKTVTSPSYYRLEVSETNTFGTENKTLWSNPIWVNTTRNCSYESGINIFTGIDNTIGLNNGDTRFLCLNNRFYECGSPITNNAFAYETSNKEVIANYKCDLTNSKWEITNDCGSKLGSTVHTGIHNTVGLNNGDTKFLCLNNKFYECGWTENYPEFVI